MLLAISMLATYLLLLLLWPHHHVAVASAISLSREILTTMYRRSHYHRRRPRREIPCCLVRPIPMMVIYSFRHRRPTTFNTCNRLHLHAPSDNETDSEIASSSIIIHPTRCSSRDAASMIRNCSASDNLLIITCDASGRGGGSKHDGIASILRVRHGASYLPETTSYYTIGSHDLIDVFARRSIPSRTSSEVAAISFGMKCALRSILPSWREQVLILSDSEFAIDFFTGIRASKSVSSNNNIAVQRGRVGNKRLKGRRKIKTSSMELRDEAHRRMMLSLLKETPKGVLFSKVRSSSRGVRINHDSMDNNIFDEDCEAEFDTTSWNGMGFIDHDAADHLSSVIRSSANNSNDTESTTFGVSNVADPLGWDDLLWLENSDPQHVSISGYVSTRTDQSDNNEFWQTFEVLGSDARCYRKKRNQRRIERIEKMIGLLQCNDC